MTTLLDRLKTLTAIDAVSGQEQPLVAFLRDVLAPLVDSLEIDGAGTLYAALDGAEEGPTVLIAAHTD
jgi:putative aminopeptidase